MPADVVPLKHYEVRAFLPAAVTTAQGSPLAGLDSFFFRTDATDPVAAHQQFLSQMSIKLNLDTLDHGVIMINPKTCVAAHIYEILDAPVPAATDAPRPAEAKPSYLKRVK